MSIKIDELNGLLLMIVYVLLKTTKKNYEELVLLL